MTSFKILLLFQMHVNFEKQLHGMCKYPQVSAKGSQLYNAISRFSPYRGGEWEYASSWLEFKSEEGGNLFTFEVWEDFWEEKFGEFAE